MARSKNKKPLSNAAKLLQVIQDSDEMLCNLEGKPASDFLTRLTDLLLEDSYWACQHLTQARAKKIVSAFSDYAKTGQLPDMGLLPIEEVTDT